MPQVVFYVRRSYGYKMEDILLAANDGRQQKLRDISDWEREQIRNYLNLFIDVFRKWESDGKLIDPRDRKTLDAEIRFSASSLSSVKTDGSKSKGREFRRSLALGENQLQWLKRDIAFYRAAQVYLNRTRKKDLPPVDFSESRCESVGDFITVLTEGESWKLLAQADKKEIEREH